MDQILLGLLFCPYCSYLNDIELPPFGGKTFRVSERALSRPKFGYLTPMLVKISVETLKVWQGSNLS